MTELISKLEHLRAKQAQLLDLQERLQALQALEVKSLLLLLFQCLQTEVREQKRREELAQANGRTASLPCLSCWARFNLMISIFEHLTQWRPSA